MRPLRRSLIVVFLTAIVLAPAAARTAGACSCMENPPCAVAGRADAVFVGTVLQHDRETISGSLGWVVHQVAVSRSLRGSAGEILTLVPDVTVTPADMVTASRPGEFTLMSTCDYRFEVGEEYLIYARRTPDGRWTTSQCAGTKRLVEASGDLDYLADLVRATPSGRVYGSVSRIVLDASDPTGTGTTPAAGVRVEVTGTSGRRTVTTAANGEFELRLPPGEYSVAPLVPATVKAYGSPSRISLPAYACAPVRFSLTPNGRIEGRVLQSDGAPATDAQVDLVPPDQAVDRAMSSALAPSGTTDAQGRFSIDAIMPGRYLMAVNARFGPRPLAPYLPTYLVSPEGREPRVIELGAGERRTGFTLVVTPLAETTVAGRALFADGRPAADANIVAMPVDHRGSVVGSTKANSAGDFELRVLAGVTYVVRAGTPTPNGYRQMEIVIAVDGPRDDLRLLIQP